MTVINEDAFQFKTYKRFPLALVSGNGVWVKDTGGIDYLDLYGGHAVATTGHNHPHIVATLKQQLDQLLFYSNMVSMEIRARAAEHLIKACPVGLDKVFFVNSGAEATENALKIARTVTTKPGVISFAGAFHGRTLGSIMAAGSAKYRDSAGVEVPHYYNVPWADADAVEQLLQNNNIAAVILEPIQSLSGVRTAPAEFFQQLRHLCNQYGALLIYDELQTGIGRTGTFLFASRHDVMPDIVTLGKGIGSGIPMGAVVAAERIAAHFSHGDLGTTFGGGPLAAAALNATLDVIEQEDLLTNVQRVSAYLRERLSTLGLVDSIDGEGFLLGLRFAGGAKPVQEALLAKHILTGTSDDPQVLRLLPPLTLLENEVDVFINALQDVCSTEHRQWH